MVKAKYRRLIIITTTITCIAIGVSLILYNLEKNIVFFYPPSKIDQVQSNINIRIGGIVKSGSILKSKSNQIQFIITDNIQEISVTYSGILPALFRANQGVVAEGKLLDDRTFVANRLLTKHDENYRPPYANNL